MPARSRVHAELSGSVVIVSMSSCSSKGLDGTGPVGWRETAPAALWRTPGTWISLNLYRSVFSLRLRSRMLAILSKERSPRTLSSGLWSTAMIRFSQPRTKNRALSNASATAKASPSIRAYRDSAGCVNRLPTSVIFQPVWQQKGSVDWQLQCFWNNQNPRPVLDQSVARQVGFVLSKIRTPSSISLMITDFDSSNSVLSSLFQVNVVSGSSD